MLTAFGRAFKTPDLRRKLLFTLAMIGLYRLGSVVPGMTGILSAHWALGDAMVVCALSAYAMAFAMALILPEAAGIDLRAVDAEGAPAPELAGRQDRDAIPRSTGVTT